ncbi:ThuA domain-containing protein [bacterium]|nr:trehalose utilization [Planctomicrobium sp.]MDB4802409.1 ThuA domain-containing protein [bacterium]
MQISKLFYSVASICCCLMISMQANADETTKRKIALVAGTTAKVDKVGHHDYLAGCQSLQVLLEQTKDVETVFIQNGWPKDAAVFDDVSAIVFYTDGGGKQAFLESPERIESLLKLADSGVGIVMIHQAVDFPKEHAVTGKKLLGGIYLGGKSGRGHWPSTHIEFPEHPVTRGVTPWKINDGWLNNLDFVDDMKGISPLVWSGKEVEESREGVDAHIVAWTFNRPDGGRSFSFSGLDAHSAWELPGMRKFVVNGILWSAGVVIPNEGAPSEISKEALDTALTPRTPKATPKKKST